MSSSNKRPFPFPVESLKVKPWKPPTPVKIIYPEAQHGAELCTLSHTKTLVGCSHTFEELVLYSRVQAVDAINFLEDKEIRRAVLDGPPGSGKSSAAWFYALFYSKEATVCWVDVKNLKVLTLKDQMISMNGLATIDPIDLEGDLLVLDGVTRQDVDGKFRHCIADIQRAKILIVSSLQFQLRVTDFLRFTMKAWTLREYYKAVKYDEFFSKVLQNLLLDDEVIQTNYSINKRKQLVLRKFRFAGHSARYMFDLNMDNVVKDINSHIECVSNYRDLFHNWTGQRAPGFKNTLVVTDPRNKNQMIFTSAYVSRRLGMMCPDSIAQLRNLVEVYGNDAMKGHVFEAEFLYMVRKADLNNRVIYIKEDKQYPELTYVPSMKGVEEEEKEGAEEEEEEEEKEDVEEEDEEDVEALSTTEEPKQAKNISAIEHKAGTENENAAVTRYFEDRADNSFQASDGEIEFYNKVLDKNTDINVVTVHRWLVPLVPNQGGFDCVKLCLRDGITYLRFVQLTVQQDHSIKLNHMIVFLDDFNERRKLGGLGQIDHFEVVMVLPILQAPLAKVPWEWKVTGIPRGMARHGKENQYTFNFRVAGYIYEK